MELAVKPGAWCAFPTGRELPDWAAHQDAPGGIMKKSLLMVALPVSVLGLGLAGFMAVRMANKAPADDFAKELEKADAAGIQLASQQSAKQFSLSETVPETKPEAKTVSKRATSGNKAVRSKTPTVKAAPENVAADVVEEIP